jgi:hypothetical protein
MIPLASCINSHINTLSLTYMILLVACFTPVILRCYTPLTLIRLSFFITLITVHSTTCSTDQFTPHIIHLLSNTLAQPTAFIKLDNTSGTYKQVSVVNQTNLHHQQTEVAEVAAWQQHQHHLAPSVLALHASPYG